MAATKKIAFHPTALIGRDGPKGVTGWRVLDAEALMACIAGAALLVIEHESPSSDGTWIIQLPPSAGELLTSGVGLVTTSRDAYLAPDLRSGRRESDLRREYELPCAGVEVVIQTAAAYLDHLATGGVTATMGSRHESHVILEVRPLIEQPGLLAWAPPVNDFLRQVGHYKNGGDVEKMFRLLRMADQVADYWERLAVVAD